MEANVSNPRLLFDGNICYEVPPFQRPYVWTEEDQWQPLWDDIVRVVDAILELPDSVQSGEPPTHFLGAVVLKFIETSAVEATKHSIIDGQQRLMTLQLLLAAAQLVLEQHGDEADAESIQELVSNGAKRFRNKSSRFKLWPSRVDRGSFEVVMDKGLDVPDDSTTSRICQAHMFFRDVITEWADVTGDPDKVKARLATLAQVLQQHLQVVAINLSSGDDVQLIFETLNDRGTPLLAADLIKNYVFQQCELIGADVDTWSAAYWQDFDEDWWRDQVAQGRLFRSRIDLFLQYWLTMRLRDEIPTEAVFSRFRTHAEAHLRSVVDAEPFLRSLRRDADKYRELVTQGAHCVWTGFYDRIVEALELGTFIPLVLWLISDNHDVPEAQVHKALCALESMAIRRTLLRMTMKDINKLVVAILRELDGKPMDEVGDVVERYLAQQTADSRSWPSDGELRELLPSIRLYGNIKQSRLRVLLSAVELAQRTPLTENLALPQKLEVEHVMPRGWRTYWGEDLRGDHELAPKRDVLVDTLGNLTLVTKKLNGTLSNRPWRDDEVVAVAGAREGKRKLLSHYSLLVLNKNIVDQHPESWTEQDIRERAKQLTEVVISIWPRSGSPSRAEAVRTELAATKQEIERLDAQPGAETSRDPSRRSRLSLTSARERSSQLTALRMGPRQPQPSHRFGCMAPQ